MNGQGSVALELLEQQTDLDAIVAGRRGRRGASEERKDALWGCQVSIGGGGLISGIATYVADLAGLACPLAHDHDVNAATQVKSVNKAIKVIGAEPERARSEPCEQIWAACRSCALSWSTEASHVQGFHVEAGW